MRNSFVWAVGMAAAATLTLTSGLMAQDQPAAAAAAPAGKGFGPPEPGPGVFVAKPVSGDTVQLVLTGKKLTTREEAERYLLYRAAETTLARKTAWFQFVRQPAAGEQVQVSAAEGEPKSFRLENFQPTWRYQTGDATWKTWSPFSGKPFLDGASPGSVTAFEVSAQITPKKGAFPYRDPLAFEAAPVSEILVMQVKPPA